LALALSIFGQALQSPWALDVSPSTHAPKLLGGTMTAAPLLWLAVIALALCASRLAPPRRRDTG
jgi:ABC-2 type transport system permease protein